MYDVIAIGEILIDFTPALFEKESGFIPKPGGAPANVSVAVSRLGGKSAFIGKVGDDQFGKLLVNTLVSEQVSVEGIKVDPSAPTTLAFVHLDVHGDRSFSFYRENCADTRLLAKEIPLNMLEGCRILHFGSLSLTDSPSREATCHAIASAKSKGCLISFDPNYRPLLWKSEKAAAEEIKKALAYADIVKVSEEELIMLTDTQDLQKGTEIIMSYGPSTVLITLGSKGAYYNALGHSGYCKAVPNVAVKDTNGAGDSFMGAVLYQIAKLSDYDEIRNTIKSITHFANVAGAITTTRYGAIPALPTLTEVENHEYI